MHQYPLTPSLLAQQTREIFSSHVGLPGLFARWRPFICPFDIVLSHFPANRQALLDVGCGMGTVSLLATRLGLIAAATGFDPSLPAINLAQQARRPADPVTFLYLPPGRWPAGQFDVITCIDVLHHVPFAQHRSFFQQLVGHLKPGGRLIFKEISPRPRWRALANLTHDLIISHQLVRLVPIDSVRQTLIAAGLEVSPASFHPRLWYSHYLLIADRPA